jgi:ribosomal protein S18 acetylase RimI-like enzyme
MNIWGLGVNEQHRRKNIATALVAHAMAQSYKLGARFASVCTQLWNAPAHAKGFKGNLRDNILVIYHEGKP